MYFERIGKHLKIMEEIGNLTEDQTESLWIKEILNALIAGKKVISNLNVRLNQRIKRGIKLIIRILDF